jgi:hypothetical protein
VTSPRVRLWYALLVAFVACVVVAGSSVVYASAVQRQAQARTEAERRDSDRRWCALLSDLDRAYQTSPSPTTETGRKVAAEIHKLRVGFGCPAN